MSSYGLYQTFAPSENSESITTKQKNALQKKFSNLDTEQSEAVLMLICEHARLNEDFVYDPSNIVLPYGLEQKKSTVGINIENLPEALQQILWSFSNVIN